MSEHSPFLSAFLFTQQQLRAEPLVSLPFSFLPSFAAPIEKKIMWLFWRPNPILSLVLHSCERALSNDKAAVQPAWKWYWQSCNGGRNLCLWPGGVLRDCTWANNTFLQATDFSYIIWGRKIYWCYLSVATTVISFSFEKRSVYF